MGRKRGKPSVLISDLGNVLVFFDHMTIARNLAAKLETGPKNIYQQFLESNIHNDFVLGRIDDQTFYQRAKHLFDRPLFPDFQQFTRIWSDIFTTNWPMVETLRSVQKNMTLVLLSNTNNLHFRWIEKHHSEVVELFDGRLVLSHKVGTAKPDERIFEAALQAAGLNIQPSDCLYIDDLAEYVVVAESIGMKAHQYTDHDRFTKWLESVLH